MKEGELTNSVESGYSFEHKTPAQIVEDVRRAIDHVPPAPPAPRIIPGPLSYIRDDGTEMIEMAPGRFVNATIAKRL